MGEFPHGTQLRCLRVNIEKMAMETKFSTIAQVLYHTWGTHCHLGRNPLTHKIQNACIFQQNSSTERFEKSATEGNRLIKCVLSFFKLVWKLTMPGVASVSWACSFFTFVSKAMPSMRTCLRGQPSVWILSSTWNVFVKGSCIVWNVLRRTAFHDSLGDNSKTWTCALLHHKPAVSWYFCP